MTHQAFAHGFFAALLATCTHAALAQEADPSRLRNYVAAHDTVAIRALGRPILPRLVKLYETTGDAAFKASVARTLYELGWKSPEAKLALMKDVRTQSTDLRLQVQWALGRVSADEDVVDTLLANMRHDANPLFRDKAACALAYDQIHLTEAQKIRLFTGLISALNDEKLDVRSIALLALEIHTGQTKGFNPNGTRAEREQKARVWQRWLQQYQASYKSGL